jgi:hypothetical protein
VGFQKIKFPYVVIHVQLGAASDNGEEDIFINSTSAYANNSTSLNERVGIKI